MWTSTEEDDSKKITSGEENQRTDTDSYNVLLRIKHGVVKKCLDEGQAHYKPS